MESSKKQAQFHADEILLEIWIDRHITVTTPGASDDGVDCPIVDLWGKKAQGKGVQCVIPPCARSGALH
jgi:hypothetical protein